MIKVLKRWWKYTVARLNGSFNERADPKVQLEQAITEAHERRVMPTARVPARYTMPATPKTGTNAMMGGGSPMTSATSPSP